MKILKYKNDYNTPTLANKQLSQLEGNLYYYTETDEYNNNEYNYYIKCKNDIYYPLGRTRNNLLDNEYIDKYKNYDEQNIFELLANKDNNGQFISKLDILFCELMGENELAKHYTEYRESYLKEQELQRQEKERQRQLKEQERQEKERQKQLELLDKAQTKFYNGNEITAQEFEMLCNKYNVTIPIKVLGWLREYCFKITAKKWDNEQLLKEYGYIPNFTTKYDIKYFYKKGHNSTSIASLIDKLATAMNI